MFAQNLLVKGAFYQKDGNPVISRFNVSRFDPHGYNKDFSVFELKVDDQERKTSLSLEFVNLHDTCFMRDAIYSSDQWSIHGLLMSISISFHMTKYEKYIVIGSYLFDSLLNAFKCNASFPELNLVESEYKGEKAYHIHYSPEKIKITHFDDVFSATPENTILDCALDNNIELKHMCKAGICMKCRKKILSGACMVSSPSEEGSMVKIQHVLTCNYKALTSLLIG